MSTSIYCSIQDIYKYLGFTLNFTLLVVLLKVKV